MNTKKVITLILDGWGLGEPDDFNAIANAKTPNFDRLVREYPNTRLKSDGLAVGLPEGQFGTSEVNHMTIGAGRVILQDLPKLNKAIETEAFYSSEEILSSFNHASNNASDMHLVGMFSDGGIHSQILHAFALFEFAKRINFKQNIFLHIFTDGGDTPPKSFEKYMRLLDAEILKYKDLNIIPATIQGRFYLDRDRDWEKTSKAVDLIIKGEGKKFNGWQEIINYEYNQNNTDEFFPQYVINERGKVKENDSIIFFHYRTDRLYQLVEGIRNANIKNLKLTTFIKVSEDFHDVDVAFPREQISGTLAEAIAANGKSQLHITETEKFPHLTFFLNGEKEHEMEKEDWSMVKSNRYVKPYYNFEPSMQNFEITKGIIESVKNSAHDFIIANLTSADMVGHTGNYEAAVISAESIDYCLGKIFEAVKEKLDEYALIITADHGNSDIMWDYDNDQPHTQHTLNPVPFILVSDLNCKLDRRESLEDVAPTILDLMGIAKPQEMRQV